MEDSKKESDINIQVLRGSTTRIAIGVAVVLGIAYMVGIILGFLYDAKFIEIMYQHLVAVIGLPGSVITAFVIVTVLEQVSGPIKFEGLGFKFEGASGPVIMWVIVFSALVSGLKILW